MRVYIVPRLRYFIAAMLSVLLADVLVMFVAFRDPGPLRAHVYLELSGLLFALACNDVALQKLRVGGRLRRAGPVAAVVLTCLHLSNLQWLPAARRYHEAFADRLSRTTKGCSESQSGKLSLPVLPESGLIHSVFANDNVWVQNVYLRYFNCTKPLELDGTVSVAIQDQSSNSATARGRRHDIVMLRPPFPRNSSRGLSSTVRTRHFA